MKGLEGHVVNSVEIDAEGGFLHVKMSAIELDPQYALHETLGGPKELKFSVIWKKTYDRMMDEIISILEKSSSTLKEADAILKERERKTFSFFDFLRNAFWPFNKKEAEG